MIQLRRVWINSTKNANFDCKNKQPNLILISNSNNAHENKLKEWKNNKGNYNLSFYVLNAHGSHDWNSDCAVEMI